MMGLLLGVLFIGVVLMVFIIVSAVRVGPGEGGEEMIKNVYIYVVLFATLMMTIGGSVAAFMAAADIIAPVPYHQTFEEYKKWGETEKPRLDNGEAQETTLSDAELKEKYEALVSAERERQINRAKNNLFKSFGWIVIPLPVFIYFQRRLQKKETEA